jgi:hypothetical protein
MGSSASTALVRGLLEHGKHLSLLAIDTTSMPRR